MGTRLTTLILVALTACRSASSASASRASAGDPADERAPGVALVELYTSEGCSSCPPADKLLAELTDDSTEGVYTLSFHVDYWDDLGWPDPFASHTYTNRQETYSRTLGVRGLYTPQMVVNGEEEFIGSDRDRAQAAVARALSVPAKVRIAMHPRWTASDAATVEYEVSRTADNDASLFLAVVQRQAVTSVRGGENAGRTLRHQNVVRAFASVPLTTAKGLVVVHVPPILVPVGVELIGWVQDSPTLVHGVPVLGAARASLPDR